MDRSSPSVAQSTSDVSGALIPRTSELSAEIYALIVREIPQLRSDKRVLALLEASVRENVATMLHVLHHGIDLDNVRAPAAAEEYARRLAQRGVPMAALLRAYRIGSARFQDRCLAELGRSTDDAALVSAAGLRIADVTATYIDRVSEELVSAYEGEKENWLRNLSAARAARVRVLLQGERVDDDVGSSEAILGYRLRQHHAGVVCWVGEADAGGGDLARLERATAELARTVGCAGRPIFLPQDESYAWAWLPLGAKQTLTIAAADPRPAETETGARFAVGAVGSGVAGFRRTHQQALAAYAVALAAGPPGRFMTSFSDVAPLALMSGSIDLARAWVIEILGGLASDDGNNATLRDTLRVFLQENGSFKATAERLVLHKNTVQYRVRKAEESLGHPVGENRLHVELALLASQWLGAAVLRQAGAPAPGRRDDRSRAERSMPG
ncbi:MAG: helix-turn-helix domain-containing protein [Actinobacteria bacterium]|nr:helix-turn-helix domain-containing protein [Actinomycetota bacterium]